MNQKQKILQILNEQDWVCGTKFMQEYIPEYRSRLNEIRKSGYVIENRLCTQHTHKGGLQEWRLVPRGTEIRTESNATATLPPLSAIQDVPAKSASCCPSKTIFGICERACAKTLSKQAQETSVLF
jgi:hypothetical protein